MAVYNGGILCINLTKNMQIIILFTKAVRSDACLIVRSQIPHQPKEGMPYEEKNSRNRLHVVNAAPLRMRKERSDNQQLSGRGFTVDSGR